MAQTLALSTDVYRKLAHGAAKRGITIESLVEELSDFVAPTDNLTKLDRQRIERIEELFDRFRDGPLNGKDQKELEELIAADYDAAYARAEKLIQAKGRAVNKDAGHPKRNGAQTSRKRSRK
jgi:hypothetical protein